VALAVMPLFSFIRKPTHASIYAIGAAINILMNAALRYIIKIPVILPVGHDKILEMSTRNGDSYALDIYGMPALPPQITGFAAAVLTMNCNTPIDFAFCYICCAVYILSWNTIYTYSQIIAGLIIGVLAGIIASYAMSHTRKPDKYDEPKDDQCTI